ncbi:MAG: DJ-1 family glyoxalase III [bacterium]
MHKRVCVPLAEGFEEVEALTIVDLLRRAGVVVVMAALADSREVISSHGVKVVADSLLAEACDQTFDMIVLPGGMPGSKHLDASEQVRSLLVRYDRDGKFIAALCAAPMVLGHAGLLKGKKATSHFSQKENLRGATYADEPVVVDGRVVTSQGVGTAIPFALKLVELLVDRDSAEKIRNAIMYKQAIS